MACSMSSVWYCSRDILAEDKEGQGEPGEDDGVDDELDSIENY